MPQASSADAAGRRATSRSRARRARRRSRSPRDRLDRLEYARRRLGVDEGDDCRPHPVDRVGHRLRRRARVPGLGLDARHARADARRDVAHALAEDAGDADHDVVAGSSRFARQASMPALPVAESGSVSGFVGAEEPRKRSCTSSTQSRKAGIEVPEQRTGHRGEHVRDARSRGRVRGADRSGVHRDDPRLLARNPRAPSEFAARSLPARRTIPRGALTCVAVCQVGSPSRGKASSPGSRNLNRRLGS